MGIRVSSFALSAAFALAMLSPTETSAHSGGTDEYGCHTNHSTDEYHCHGSGGGDGSREAEMDGPALAAVGGYALALTGVGLTWLAFASDPNYLDLPMIRVLALLSGTVSELVVLAGAADTVHIGLVTTVNLGVVVANVIGFSTDPAPGALAFSPDGVRLGVPNLSPIEGGAVVPNLVSGRF